MAEIDTYEDAIATLKTFLAQVGSGKTVHITRTYTGSDTGAPGIAMLVVSAPDDVVHEAHQRMDSLVADFFGEHGIRLREPS